MDKQLIRSFQRQIQAQCEYVLIAANEIDVALNQHRIEHTFYAIQNLLNAAANIAKALWGQGGRLANDRKVLRDSIGVLDASPLKVVTMRNNFEHFDERLDHWWATSARHNCVDFNIVPQNAIAGVDEIDMFRNLDPATGELTFWGQLFNIKELIDEVRRIYPKVLEEANRLH